MVKFIEVWIGYFNNNGNPRNKKLNLLALLAIFTTGVLRREEFFIQQFPRITKVALYFLEEVNETDDGNCEAYNEHTYEDLDHYSYLDPEIKPNGESLRFHKLEAGDPAHTRNLKQCLLEVFRGLKNSLSESEFQQLISMSDEYSMEPSRKFFQVCSAPRTAGYTRNIHTSLRLHNIDEYRKRYDQANSAHEAQMKYRNRTSAYYAASLGIVFLALGFSAVPVYRAVCKRTGWAGTPITDSTKFGPEKVVPVDTNKRIRIQFTCQSSGVLPWKFTPLQREVYVVPGETALAFYRAKNMSNEDIIGMATYTVTPDQVAGYFNKIQCFFSLTLNLPKIQQ